MRNLAVIGAFAAASAVAVLALRRRRRRPVHKGPPAAVGVVGLGVMGSQVRGNAKDLWFLALRPRDFLAAAHHAPSLSLSLARLTL
jgi:hypothetical protein